MSLLKSLAACTAAMLLITTAVHAQAVTDVVDYTGGTYSQAFSTLPTTTASVAPNSPVVINGVTYTLPAAAVPYAFDNTALGLTGAPAPASIGGSAMAGWWAVCVANAKLGANPGDSTTGGIISFGANTGTTTRALGLITTSSTGLGYFGAAIENGTGSPISTIDLGFTAELWHQGASKPLAYGYVVDNTDSLTLLTAGTSASLVSVGSATLTGAATGSLDGTQAANQVPVSAQNLTLSTPLQAGGVLWIIFDYGSTTGSSQGWGVANFTFSQGASAPVITAEPAAVIANSGASASFTVVATGSGDTYLWYTGTPPGGSSINGATSSTYTIPSVVSGSAGTYYVVVTDSVGSATSTAATLTVNSASSSAITTEPSSQTVVAGNPATFTVVATGTPAPTYQWTFNGTAIGGATSASYLISSVATANAGSYAVTASNPGGSVTSTGATLTVDVVPSLTTQPSGATIFAGQSVTFSAAGTGNPAPTFQWSFGGTAIPGATSSTYTVAYASPATAGGYTVTVTNAAGSATSSAAALALATISDVVPYSGGTYSQAFSTLPYDLAPVGTATTTSVNAANPVTVNGVTYTLPAENVPFAFDDTTLGAGTSIGGTAMAGWYGVGNAADQFGSQDGDQTTGGVIGFGPSTGPNRALGLIATSSSGGTAFGVAIQNNTGVSLSTVSLAFTGEFWKQGGKTNTLLYGYTVDNTATLNLALAATAAAGVNLGSLGGVGTGGLLQAATGAVGAVDGTNPANQAPVSLSSLALTTPLQPGGILWITVQMPTVVSGGQGFAIANFSFTAAATVPSLTTQPSSQAVTAPASASFTAAAAGFPAPSYQWFFAGSAISGATSSTYSTGATSVLSAGAYFVIASNSAGSATSATATLTVNSVPVIVTQPASQTVAFGSTVSFSVVVTGAAPAYQWSFGGTAIGGATSASYTFVNATQSNDGTYAVTASNSAGSVVSSAATLTVGLPNLTYFGSFGSGNFALVFTGTGTGVLFAYDPTSGLLIGQASFTVAGNGTFTVTGTAGGGTAAAGSGPTADVAGSFSITGVASGGGVTGTITGVSGLTTFASSGGSHPSAGGFAGIYQAGQIGGSGTTTYVVSGDGDLFALVQTSAGAAVGSGTVNGSGLVTIGSTSSPSVSITGTLAGNGTAAAVVTTSGVPSNYSGGTSAALAAVSIASSAGSAEVGAGDNAEIAGFVVAGPARPILILGLGPQLASVSAAPVLHTPLLQLYQSGTVAAIDSNAGWNLAPSAGAQPALVLQSDATVYDPSITLSTVGTSSGGDCGILTSATGPGVYTALLNGGTGTGQLGELDVYDTGSVSAGQSLTNTSLRGFVPAGGSLVDQFSVKSSDGSPARLLIRAVGPGLSAFTAGGSPVVNAPLLSNPMLTVYNAEGVVQGLPNKGWTTSPDGTNGVSSNLATTAASVGAFALTTANADSAMIISLAPGTYTASVTSSTSQAGVVLIEVYQMP